MQLEPDQSEMGALTRGLRAGKPIEGDFMSSHELLRQHMTSSAIDSIGKQKRKKKIHYKTDEYDNYKCGVCQNIFKSRGLLETHLRLHSPNDSFECELCGRSYKTKKYLAKHRTRVHEKRRNNACDVCGHSFFTKSSLASHMYIHTGEKPFECDVCGKAFNRNSVLNVHKLIHTGEKPFKCDFCSYSCRDKSSLRKHHAIHMGTTRYYSCKLCKKSFRNKYYLKLHVAELHLGADVRNYVCDLCQGKYKSRQSIVNHLRVVHTDSKIFHCTLCDRKFSSRSNMDVHVLSHYDVKTHQCPDSGCGKYFKTKTNMRRHMILHNPMMQHPCPTCGRRFTKKTNLARHMKQHETKVKNTPCPKCGVCFFNEAYLAKHTRAVHGEHRKCYQCDYCGLKVFNKPGLVTHIWHKHLKKTKYKCSTCGDEFKNLTPFKLHMWKEHRIRHKVMTPKPIKLKEVQVKEELIDIEEDDMETVWQSMTRMEEDKAAASMTKKDVNCLLKSGGALSEDVAKWFIRNNCNQLRNVPDRMFDQFFIDKPETEGMEGQHLKKTTMPFRGSQKNAKPPPRSEEPERVRYSCDRPRRAVKVINYSTMSKVADIGDEAKETMVLYPKKERKSGSEKKMDEVKIKTEDTINNNDMSDTLCGSVTVKMEVMDKEEKTSDDDATESPKETHGKMGEDEGITKATEFDEAGPLESSNVSAVDESHAALVGNDMDDNADEDVDDDISGIVIENVKEKYGKFYHVKLNMSQCYICFKLFETRDMLIDHCSEHFKVKTRKQISKCPFCKHESTSSSSKTSLYAHMKKAHNVRLNSRSTRLLVRTDADSTKFVVKLRDQPRDKKAVSARDRMINESAGEIEIVPTVVNMNRHVNIEMERKKKERGKKLMLKDKLVGNGSEWYIEKVPVTIKGDVREIIKNSPECNNTEEKEDLTDDPYLDKLVALGKVAKKEGRHMLYPCNKCPKVCQALCGLKIHRRLHNTKAKPIKPKVWKHKLKGEPNEAVAEGVVKIIDTGEPKPIKRRHHCKDDLKDFYRNCIRGSNIEFEHFLKIYNKMTRDNVNDFAAVDRQYRCNDANGTSNGESVDRVGKTFNGDISNSVDDDRVGKTFDAMIGKSDDDDRVGNIFNGDISNSFDDEVGKTFDAEISKSVDDDRVGKTFNAVISKSVNDTICNTVNSNRFSYGKKKQMTGVNKKYERVIRISRKLHLSRLAMKNEMRNRL